MIVLKKLIVCLILCAGVFARSNDEKRPAAYRTFNASAYCLKGKTATGVPVRNGLVASDRRVLPMGTKIYIHGLGLYTVADTGGAIKGNRIDIYMVSCSEAKRFGRKTVNLKVIT